MYGHWRARRHDARVATKVITLYDGGRPPPVSVTEAHTMSELKIRKIGNSYGVILPREELEHLQVR